MNLRDRLLALTLIGLGLTAPAIADTLVVANKAEATASLIDLGSGEVVATLPTGRGPHEVGISVDGTKALVTDYGQRGEPGSTLTLIDVPRAEVIGTIDLGDYTRPHGVVWMADGRHAWVTAEGAKALIEVDIDKGRVTAAIDTAQEISHMLAVGDGRAFVANIGSDSVTVIDIEKGERIANVETGEGAEGVAVAAGGQHVWVTNRAADTITVLDTATLEKVEEFESKGFPIRATATTTGHVLVTRAAAGDMMIYDAAKPGEGRQVAFDLKASGFEGRLFGDRFGDSSVPIGVVADGDGTRAWIAHANADVITEVDLESGEIARLLKAGKEPDGMGWSPRSVTAEEEGEN